MKKFIEVHNPITEQRVIVNMSEIGVIVENLDGTAEIRMKNCDRCAARENFEQLRSMIANIQGGFTVPPEMAKVGELE